MVILQDGCYFMVYLIRHTIVAANLILTVDLQVLQSGYSKCNKLPQTVHVDLETADSLEGQFGYIVST